MRARTVFFDLSDVIPKIYHTTFAILLNVIPYIPFKGRPERCALSFLIASLMENTVGLVVSTGLF